MGGVMSHPFPGGWSQGMGARDESPFPRTGRGGGRDESSLSRRGWGDRNESSKGGGVSKGGGGGYTNHSQGEGVGGRLF